MLDNGRVATMPLTNGSAFRIEPRVPRSLKIQQAGLAVVLHNDSSRGGGRLSKVRRQFGGVGALQRADQRREQQYRQISS